ncbi:hypothetical protein FUAX_09960 [Fulvitalea axinellae]|uniref:Uncharacterized protein n=1 Tax=Fulvitalea axinellae TaxID=1182444 RepID=A0AAU9C974_9BACT|nr:hypothetical protein FUAX_09960 [Fulvitalea axinellae]
MASHKIYYERYGKIKTAKIRADTPQKATLQFYVSPEFEGCAYICNESISGPEKARKLARMYREKIESRPKEPQLNVFAHA